MSPISSVSQLLMQSIVMQSISQSNSELSRVSEANGQMTKAAQLGEHAEDDLSKG